MVRMTPPSRMGAVPITQHASTVTVSITLFLATIIATVTFLRRNKKDGNGNNSLRITEDSSGCNQSKFPTRTPTSIAFIGNSILYFNDCPRLMECLDEQNPVYQNSCLRGGTSLTKLIKDGNGMSEKFATPNALLSDGKYDVGADTVEDLLNEREWDYVVMNDHTQSPTRVASREAAVDALKTAYSRLWGGYDIAAPSSDDGERNHPPPKKRPVPVFLMTWAYRRPVKKSEDLGTVEHFTELLRKGYRRYADVLDEACGAKRWARVAPVGLAFCHLYETDRVLWEKLFYRDDFHPSPHGTYLEACVLYWTVFGVAPPMVRREDDVGALWARARRMTPPTEKQMSLPSLGECGRLWEVAGLVCRREGLACDGGGATIG